MAAKQVNRSAVSGRFVSKGFAARNPRTTVRDTVGGTTGNSRTVSRSAISGLFVTTGYAKRNPAITIQQKV